MGLRTGNGDGVSALIQIQGARWLSPGSAMAHERSMMARQRKKNVLKEQPYEQIVETFVKACGLRNWSASAYATSTRGTTMVRTKSNGFMSMPSRTSRPTKSP